MNFYGKLLCFCVKFNVFSKFSHLCGYKTRLGVQATPPPAAAASSRHTIKDVNIVPTPLQDVSTAEVELLLCQCR